MASLLNQAGEEIGAQAPVKPRRKWVPWWKRPKIDYRDPHIEAVADMRGLNSNPASAAELQLAVAISAATVQVRDFGMQPNEKRTLVMASFGTFHIEETDFPAMVRKTWPDLSSTAIDLAYRQLIDILRIERRAAEQAEAEARRHQAGPPRSDWADYSPNARRPF